MSDADNEQQRRESIEHIAERAAKNAVREMMLLLGIDVADPIKAQEEFARLRTLAREIGSERTRTNLEWLDRLHTASDRISDTSWRTVTRLVVTGAAGLLVLMTREYWTQHLPWIK